MPAPLPPNEEERLKELAVYGVLDTPPEPNLDRITLLAGQIFKVPMATVAFIDRTRQWHKSRYGVDRMETGRDFSFCAYTILEDRTLVVPDARLDERFAGHPPVVGTPFLRFYAGAPLITPLGHRLGTLCILDTQPRGFTREDTAILENLARLVMDELKLRLDATRSLAELEQRKRADLTMRATRDELEVRIQQRTTALVEAEARYRGIFENAVEGIYQAAPGGALLSVNPAFARLLGHASPQALMDAVPDMSRLFVRREERAAFERRLAEEDFVENLESEARRADGERIWLSENARAVRDGMGRLLRYEGTIEDITARRTAEEALQRAREELEDRVRERTAALDRLNGDLRQQIAEREVAEAAMREAEHRFQRIVANVPGVVYQVAAHTDGSLSMPFISKGSRQIYGLEPEQLHHDVERLIDAIHPDDRPAHDAAMAASLATLRPFTWEGRLILPSGEVRWIAARSRPERLPNGDTVWHGMTFDIGELKQAQEAMRAAKEEAEKANQAKSEFLSRMSHELRTPLNAILGFGQLLELEDLTSAQSASVDQILTGGRHLLDLINEVLDIARIESGNVDLAAEAVDLHEALAAAVRFVKPLAAQHGVRLFHRKPTAGAVAALADRGRLNQVLFNLLSNAIKYNRQNGQVRVSCRRLPAQGKVRLSVADTGPGLAPEELAGLFTPFQRLGAPQRGIGGTGIGLTIARSLTEAMGGGITVESTPGQGCTFHVDLPVANDASQAQAPEAGPNGTATGGGAPPATPLPAVRTILHVDDQPANLSLVERVLETRPDLRLLTAADGRTGLALAREKHPDLLLLDLHLPDLSGEEIIRRLHNEGRARPIPVLVLSADATPSQIERLRGMGVRDYITKPFKIDTLLRAVEAALSPAGTK